MLEDGCAHARIPEFLDVIGDAIDGFIGLLAGEKGADLVRHRDEFFRPHGWTPPP